MIPTQDRPESRGGAWRLSGALLTLLLLGVAVRLISPAIFLDIASLWPVGAGLLAVGWMVKRIWVNRLVAGVPILGLLVFSWILVSSAFHFADLPGLPSSSADLRGPPADQTRFDTFSAEIEAGRLSLAAGQGLSVYRVDLVRGGGEAGVPVAIESQGEDGGQIRVIDARQPLPGDLAVTVKDNAWLRFAGWEVSLHPETTWNLTLAAPELSADLRNLPFAALVVKGRGTVQLGESTGPIPIAVEGVFTVEVPPETPVRVVGTALVPEDWTVAEDTAWFGQPETGWQIKVAEGGSVQVMTEAG